MSLKKKIAAAFIACAMTLAVVPSAFACTALYVGSDLTEDGTTMFGRIEDLGMGAPADASGCRGAAADEDSLRKLQRLLEDALASINNQL